jgi:phenylacetate-coenzyme A ligase PaaK-like adenylate-forming protein
MSTQVGAAVRSWWAPELWLDAGEPISAIVKQLNAWQPEQLVAYASMAHRLADEQQAGRLHIAPACIFTSSEVLTNAARQQIEAVWSQRLFDQYAATETGLIAAECAEHCGLHILADQVIVEVVDKRNRPVPLGADGDKLLVTTLFSRTLPLIRYELHDRVRLVTTPCRCGRPLALIAAVQGRTEDGLSFPGSAGKTVTVYPHVFHELMDTVPASGWQIVQESERVAVLLSGVRDGVDDTALAASFQRVLMAQGAHVPPIAIRRVPAIPRGSRTD